MGQAEIARHAMWQNMRPQREVRTASIHTSTYSVHAAISAVSKLDLSRMEFGLSGDGSTIRDAPAPPPFVYVMHKLTPKLH